MDGLAAYASSDSDSEHDDVAPPLQRAGSSCASGPTSSSHGHPQKPAKGSAVEGVTKEKKNKQKKSKKHKKNKKKSGKKKRIKFQQLPSLLDQPTLSGEEDDELSDDVVVAKRDASADASRDGGKRSVLDMLPAPKTQGHFTPASLSKGAQKSLQAIGIDSIRKKRERPVSASTDEAPQKKSTVDGYSSKATALAPDNHSNRLGDSAPMLMKSIAVSAAPDVDANAVAQLQQATGTSEQQLGSAKTTSGGASTEPATATSQTPQWDATAVARPAVDMYSSASAEPVVEESLPLNWSSAVDPASGETYYYNTVTQETRWDRPSSISRSAPPQSQHPSSANSYQESAAHAQARQESQKWKASMTTQAQQSPGPSSDFDLAAIVGGDRALMRELQGVAGSVREVNAYQADQWKPDPNAPRALSKKAMAVPHLVWNAQAGERQISMALPSATHKKKHQLSYLAVQAKAQEFEFAQSHARGRLTKSQTQAKYGW